MAGGRMQAADSDLPVASEAQRWALGSRLKEVAGLRTKGRPRAGGVSKRGAAGGAQQHRRVASRASLTDGREALEAMIARLELLPPGSRYVIHKLKCARKAMELLDLNSDARTLTQSEDLTSLLKLLQINLPAE